jgi:putative addiction module component (TIGR02574 family)
MSETAAKLLEEALNLAPDDRVRLAESILDSVDADDLMDDPVFRAELQRRLDSVADGTAQLVPWEQARDEMRAELARRRAARASGGGTS